MKKFYCFLILSLFMSSQVLARGGSFGGSRSSYRSSYISPQTSSSYRSSGVSRVNTTSHLSSEHWTTPGGRKIIGQPKLYNGTAAKGIKYSKPSVEHNSVISHEESHSFSTTFWHPFYFWLPWNIFHHNSASPTPTPSTLKH